VKASARFFAVQQRVPVGWVASVLEAEPGDRILEPKPEAGPVLEEEVAEEKQQGDQPLDPEPEVEAAAWQVQGRLPMPLQWGML